MPVLEDEGIPIGPFAPSLAGRPTSDVGVVKYVDDAVYVAEIAFAALVIGEVVIAGEVAVTGEIVFVCHVFGEMLAKANPVVCVNHLDYYLDIV